MKRHPLLILSLLLVSVLGSFAEAQTRPTPCNQATPNNAVCLTWGAVTTRTDGLPTQGAVTYRVEQQSGSGAWAAIRTVSTLQAYVENLAPGSYTFRVFALENSNTSAPSNTASRTIAAPPDAPPNAPVLTIAVVISRQHSPVYSVALTHYGDVPIGRPCGEYVRTWRGKRMHYVTVACKETWGYPCQLGTSFSGLIAPCA